jgi:surface antigen
MKKIIMLFVFAVLFASFSYGQKNKCAKYFGKGYCTDYIKQKVGKKPSGDAGTWNGNIDVKDVKPGDVAIFSSPSPTGHVAIVEKVIYERNTDKPYEIEITEWNWGAKSSNAEEVACYVTQKFNIQTRRTVRVNTVKAFWRP